MKNQALFSSKDKSKQLKCRLLQFLFGTLWVKGALGTFFSYVIYGTIFRIILKAYSIFRKEAVIISFTIL